jgi:phospholipase/carboxylesterase
MIEPRIVLTSRSGLIYRIREGQGKHPWMVIMLHGLGGDENSMWVLEHALPSGVSIVTPRAPFQTGERNFSWVDNALHGWPTKEDFLPAVEALKGLINELEIEIGLVQDDLMLMGFSQGAALAFATADDPAISPKAVIAAATFLPAGDFSNLEGLPIFWGHGVRDEWISIERARRGSQALKDVGAQVHFCETDVGHKMGVECLNGLQGWIERLG